MKSLDTVIFKKKKFSDLLEEIYGNQLNTKKQIIALINELKPLIVDIGDATLIVPLLKEYIEIGVKNDDQLLKMATIIQRLTQNSNVGGEGINITDFEKDQLMKEIEKMKKDG